MFVLELMNGHVLQTLREQLKVLGSRLEGSELLTSEFLRLRSRLNETSGGLGKIGAVSGSDKNFKISEYHVSGGKIVRVESECERNSLFIVCFR